MRNRIKFIIIMVMAIVCTMTANAQKYVYFATYRAVINEYGETLPKYKKDAYCPTRIEIDLEAKTLFIKTKTHGSVSYRFSDIRLFDKSISFYNEKDEQIGCIVFGDTDFSEFHVFGIDRKDGSSVIYCADYY